MNEKKTIQKITTQTKIVDKQINNNNEKKNVHAKQIRSIKSEEQNWKKKKINKYISLFRQIKKIISHASVFIFNFMAEIEKKKKITHSKTVSVIFIIFYYYLSSLFKVPTIHLNHSKLHQIIKKT